MSKVKLQWWQWALLGTTGWFGLKQLQRKVIKRTANKATARLMKDPYHENMWELISGINRTSPQIIVETNLRAEAGKVILRPLGSPKNFTTFGLEKLMFNISLVEPPLPTPRDIDLDTKTVIGPMAKKPLYLDTPIIISGMAYGLALSEKTKIALAKGAALAGTATNTGEGPFLPSERKAAKHLIIQYNRGTWNKSLDILKQADAIEIQLGQGAIGGIGHAMNNKDIDPKLRKQLGLKPGEDAVLHARLPGMSLPDNLTKLVKTLRRDTGGVPIGAKLGAGKFLERDLAILLEAGVDYIALGGAQAATFGSPPVIQDDFGLPTVYAVSRAANFLKKHGMQHKISLITAGGLFTPGDFLKVLALGADAVYIGTIALFAVSHTQVLKAMPFEPPTQIVFYDGQFSKDFNVKQGAHTMANFLKSCTQEMQEAVRALGKTAVHQVNRNDLFTVDAEMAKALDLNTAWQPAATYKRTIPGRLLKDNDQG